MRGRSRQGPQIRYFNQGWRKVTFLSKLGFISQEGEGARYEHKRGEGRTICNKVGT